MGTICSTHRGGEKCLRLRSGNLKTRDVSWVLGVYGKMMLQWVKEISRKDVDWIHVSGWGPVSCSYISIKGEGFLDYLNVYQRLLHGGHINEMHSGKIHEVCAMIKLTTRILYIAFHLPLSSFHSSMATILQLRCSMILDYLMALFQIQRLHYEKVILWESNHETCVAKDLKKMGEAYFEVISRYLP
jgi:hypothetical protein